MMDCSEIRNLLSEYLDDALDAETKALADEHLRTCAACREELDSLKTLVKGIGSIEPVKAPADFLDQLHKRMGRPSKLSKMREWLFYPLRVKIPLQLAGAAVMALILFSIFPLQQPFVKLYSKPEQEKKAEDKAYPVDEGKEIKAAGRSDALVKSAVPREIAREKDTGKPTVRSEPLVRKAATPEPEKEPREVSLNLKRQVRAIAAPPEPSEAQAPASTTVLGMGRQKLAAGEAGREDKKEGALEKEPESVLSMTKAIEAAKGKVLSVDYNQQTGRPESIRAEMPAGQLPNFYEKLRELGDLQVSPQRGTEKDSELVQIKIRLIGLQ